MAPKDRTELNSKRFESKRYGRMEVPSISRTSQEKSRQISVNIDNISSEGRTEDLLKTSLHRLHLQGRRINEAINQHEQGSNQGSAYQLLILRPWRWRQHVSSKRRLTFNGLHGVISQKMGLFIICIGSERNFSKENRGKPENFLINLTSAL
jgi:hypothetical protein